MTYAQPDVNSLLARYPALASVSGDDLLHWLDEAVAEVGDNWSDGDRANAQMALAAHRLSELGLVEGSLPAGVTAYKSGTFSASISEGSAKRVGFGSTVYGREYQRLLNRNFSGPRLMGC